MASFPTDTTPETIPGDPSKLDYDEAEHEFNALVARGAGQPYLVAVKLRDEPRTLHLRAYLAEADSKYEWASLNLAPRVVQELARATSQRRALKWSLVQSGGIAPGPTVSNALSTLIASPSAIAEIASFDTETCGALAAYLRNPGHGLFFDQSLNHDAWLEPPPLSELASVSAEDFLVILDARTVGSRYDDQAAEATASDPDEIDDFRQQIERGQFDVPDAIATMKTRGSAQKAFADKVKRNYGTKCALTGIASKPFLVASHIVPWSEDQSIRLDPANGICLSLLVDRAFETGVLLIEDDLTVRIDRVRIGGDAQLSAYLEPFDGLKLAEPRSHSPNPVYLERRRALIQRAQ